MPPEELTFPMSGERIAASYHRGRDDTFLGQSGRPCVIIGPGLGGTRDCGLEQFGEGLADAGLDALLFDYRHFGLSGGEPRHLVSVRRQLDDYRAAIAFARGLDGVDAGRLVLWGVSFSTGHIVMLAAEDPTIFALIALTPAWDGRAQLLSVLKRDGPLQALRLSLASLLDITAAARGRPPVTVPLSARPGELGALTAPGALESLTETGGPTFHNEITARILLHVPVHFPARQANLNRRPVLVQVADNDLNAPPSAAMRVAERLRAEVRHYPCDHFDVLGGQRWHAAVLQDEIEFLRRHLTPTLDTEPELIGAKGE
jgi:uncharacterized protein